MSDGLTHERNWKLGWLVAVPTSSCLLVVNPVVGAGSFLGYAFGHYCDPDLDLVGITAGEGRAMRHWKILGIFWVAYWLPYGAFFREMHRSMWTHWPGLSTAIRLVYQFWWMGLLYWLEILTYQQWHLELVVGMLVGLSLADLIHWLADVFDKSGNSKEILRKKEKETGKISGNSRRNRRR